jgi:4-amino-4-deoxy-L-arabinose transferase-like glycosyltransferase
MRTMVAEIANKPLDAKALWVPTESTLGTVALVAIVALAAALRFANLAALGEANHYYTAAVKSMLQSWHNFFFVAAEPGGSVSVDKPPVGLWLQTLSAFFFGVNGWGVLLPQILAGILSVMVLYHLVRRSFGMAAGLLAALALAITPVVVATDRNNTMDSTLILTLLLAAWAFIQATEGNRLRYLLLGVTLVGIGFNIKMLQAYLPLPAFYALYLLGSQERLMGKLGKLALATALLLVVSLSWTTIVDLTPADQRPYVGSSQDNSELNLILDYNGLNRLIGMGFGRGGNPGGGPRDGGLQPPGRGADGVFQPPSPGMDGAPPQDGAGNDMRPPVRPGDDGAFAGGQGGPGGFPGGAGGPGGSGTGQPGALRLFSAPLSKEASWLLPFGLFSALLVAFRARLRWPLAPQHQSLVLWGGWLLTSAIFFSVAGFFHEYYLVMLAPPLAALVGMGVVELWRLRQDRPWLSLGLLLIAAGGTLALQIATAQAFLKTIWWQPLVIGMFILGGVLLVAQRRQSRVALAGFACIVAAMLITPGIWSGLTTLYSSENQSLPSAYSGRASGPVNRGGLQVDQTLLNYLESHTQDTTYLMAVPSSMQGADYVLATGRPVLYLGGFMGQDQVESSASLAQMVAEGKLRFIYWGGQGGGLGSGGQSDISTWVTTACVPVRGFDSATRNTGAPDGTTAQAGGMSSPGGMQVTLYDCKG